jgi:hypothetical protein
MLEKDPHRAFQGETPEEAQAVCDRQAKRMRLRECAARSTTISTLRQGEVRQWHCECQ